MNDNIIYSVVVPLYNEQLVIEETYSQLKNIMGSTCENYELIFVNDGSTDKTRIKAEEICSNDKNIKLINFSRNFGHQCAITAGMEYASGNAIIVIDADLQDPPEVILKMIEKWKEGYDVVYGKRAKRQGETFFKKFTAKSFYRVLDSMTNINIPVDTGDFRLIDRKVCDTLNSLPERNRYVRGLVSWVGYKQTYVEFIRHERLAGDSKYPLRKMMKLAFDGITSFSYKPLLISGYLGFICLCTGIISLIIIIARHFTINTNIINFGFIIGTNFIMFGIILICIGIMGQYLGRIFDESKDRPNYIIESIINKNKESDKNGFFN